MPSLLSLGPLQPSLNGSLPEVEDHTGNMALTTNAGATMSRPVDSATQRSGPYVYPAGRPSLQTTIIGRNLYVHVASPIDSGA
jgi:hypothetical protein